MVEKLHCAVIDDELHAIEVLEAFILQTPVLELVYKTTKPIDGFLHLQKHPVDLLFLDIQMPELTGLELIKFLPEKTKVILTTAYPEYAITGFELNVADYLLKPILFDRFLQAISKINKKDSTEEISPPTHSGFSENEYWFLRTATRGKLIKIALADILFIESLGNYVIIQSKTEKHITLITMKEVEEKLLSRNNFIRVHKSYLVQIDHIKSIDGNRIWIDKKEIPIGDKYKDILMKQLERRIL